MEKGIRINHTEQTITLYSSFAKRANIYGTAEYISLQQCRKDFPTYRIITRSIKKNSNKQKYKGLTYDYMIDYIEKNKPDVLVKFNKLRDLAKCHKSSYSYPVIKKWFLDTFEEVKDFGKEQTDNNISENSSLDNNTSSTLQNSQSNAA